MRKERGESWEGSGKSFRVTQVIEVPQYLFAMRGSRERIRSDNGAEFVAQAVTR